jgi:hypothetical protein
LVTPVPKPSYRLVHEIQPGQLYCTLLATLMLEVYYRHLPIYGKGSVDEDIKE